MKRRHFIICTGLITVLLCACNQQSPPETVPSPKAPARKSTEAPVLKVAVFADGRLTVDGATATLQSLLASLKSLSEKHGVLWYYREAGDQDPPPIAMEVMNAVVEARLPIRLSSRPDYSDAIGADGRPTMK